MLHMQWEASSHKSVCCPQRGMLWRGKITWLISDVCFVQFSGLYLVSKLVFWAQSTTKDCIRADWVSQVQLILINEAVAFYLVCAGICEHIFVKLQKFYEHLFLQVEKDLSLIIFHQSICQSYSHYYMCVK